MPPSRALFDGALGHNCAYTGPGTRASPTPGAARHGLHGQLLRERIIDPDAGDWSSRLRHEHPPVALGVRPPKLKVSQMGNAKVLTPEEPLRLGVLTVLPSLDNGLALPSSYLSPPPYLPPSTAASSAALWSGFGLSSSCSCGSCGSASARSSGGGGSPGSSPRGRRRLVVRNNLHAHLPNFVPTESSVAQRRHGGAATLARELRQLEDAQRNARERRRRQRARERVGGGASAAATAAMEAAATMGGIGVDGGAGLAASLSSPALSMLRGGWYDGALAQVLPSTPGAVASNGGGNGSGGVGGRAMRRCGTAPGTLPRSEAARRRVAAAAGPGGTIVAAATRKAAREGTQRRPATPPKGPRKAETLTLPSSPPPPPPPPSAPPQQSAAGAARGRAVTKAPPWAGARPFRHLDAQPARFIAAGVPAPVQ